MISKVGNAVFGQKKAEINVQGERNDGNTGGKAISNKKVITFEKKPYTIFPWGKNNRLPNEMADLLRSNADVLNLMAAKKDFLYGAGIGLFLKVVADGVESLEPIDISTLKSKKAAEFLDKTDISEYNEACVSHLVDMANLFINISVGKDKLPSLTAIDPVLCRCDREVNKFGKVSQYLVSPDWTESTIKGMVITPSYNSDVDLSKQGEFIYHLKPTQTGQFYYGYAGWWSVKEAITLANRLWAFHNNGLDTEYNASKMVRVARDYFERCGTDFEGGVTAFKDQFWENIDSLLSGEQGSNRMIADECEVGPNGLIPYIEIISIDSGLKGDEYLKLYETTILTFANASGILSNIAGVSNGKVMGGSGSELRVSAEFQQQYRTVRERQLILKVLNQVIIKQLELPANAVFAYKSITLQTLDKNPTGVQKTVSNSN